MNGLGGIPIVIGSAFPASNKITLPLDSELGNPTEVLFMEYQFTLEEKVIEWCKNVKRAKEQENPSQEVNGEGVDRDEHHQLKPGFPDDNHTGVSHDRMDTDDPQNALTNGCITSRNEIDMKDQTEKPVERQDNRSPQHQEPFRHVLHNNILVPTPIADGASAIANHASEKPGYAIDLHDFESEQDPFDNLELEVLDDMAELNKVLQGAQPVNQNNSSSPFRLEEKE